MPDLQANFFRKRSLKDYCHNSIGIEAQILPEVSNNGRITGCPRYCANLQSGSLHLDLAFKITEENSLQVFTRFRISSGCERSSHHTGKSSLYVFNYLYCIHCAYRIDFSRKRIM